MTTAAIDHELEQLREAVQRVSDNLLELEADPVRMALQDAALEGESAERCRAARDQLMWLWESYGALARVLARATDARGTRGRISKARLDEIAALLHGKSIELEAGGVALEARPLLGSAVQTVQGTPEEVLSWMSAAFDEVRDLVAAVGAAWDTGRARAAAAAARTAEGDQLRARLDALDARLVSDPLGVDLAELEATEATIAAAADRAARASALRDGLADRIAEVRAQLDEADRAEDEARLAYAELTAKVLAPAAPELPRTALSVDPDEAQMLADQGAWEDAAALLDGCAAGAQARLDRAREAMAASRAPIEQRDRMRGLLDAYRGKAYATGRIEDRTLGELYAAATDALYTAPTDLGRAGALVRRIQEALR